MSKWTDEQAADAAIACLAPQDEITVMRSWFRPTPRAWDSGVPGPSEWVPVKEHSSVVLALGRRILDLEAEVAAMRAELETERLRLAACGVVAMANTPETAAKARVMLPEYMSASCQDVMRAVDREMSMRAVVEAAGLWRTARMEYEALSAAVQQRFADAGRPAGYSAWNEDEKKRHTDLLCEMLSLLNLLEEAVDALRQQQEGK